MPGRVEGVVHRCVGGQEPLSRGLELTALHLSLSPSNGQVAVLSTVVFPQPPRSMKVAKAKFVQRRGIGPQAICGDDLGLHGLVLEQAAKELQGCSGVPFPLHYKVQNLAFVINGAPEVHAPAAHFAHHLIQMPPGRGAGSESLQPPSDLRPELDRPASDGLVADVDPTLGKKLLDVAKAQREAKI